MSQAKHLEQLRRSLEASNLVIDDLIQENYHLKSLLREQQDERPQVSRIYSAQAVATQAR